MWGQIVKCLQRVGVLVYHTPPIQQSGDTHVSNTYLENVARNGCRSVHSCVEVSRLVKDVGENTCFFDFSLGTAAVLAVSLSPGNGS